MKKTMKLLLMSHFLTLTSLSTVLCQRHRDACFNSVNQLPDSKEDIQVGYLNKCFRVQAHFLTRVQRIHLSVIWERKSALCRSIYPKVIEILGRGSTSEKNYRYPMGDMIVDETHFCNRTNPDSYHRNFINFPSSILTVKRETCRPLEIRDPNFPDLYIRKSGTQFAVFNRLQNNVARDSRDNEIVACMTWIFLGSPRYSKYIMDFTAEIIFEFIDTKFEKFVQSGKKVVPIFLDDPKTACSNHDNIGIRTYKVEELVPVAGKRPDDGSLTTPKPATRKTTTTKTTAKPLTTTTTKRTTTTTTPTKTTEKPPPPKPVTHTIEIISARPHPTSEITSHTEIPNVNEGKADIFSGCHFTKQCVTNIKGCLDTKTCEIVVSSGEGKDAYPQHGEIVFEIYGTTFGWTAMGLSEDNKMGHDLVVECVRENDDVNVYMSWNVKRQPCNLGPRGDLCVDNERLTGNNSVDGVIRLIKTSSFETTIYCRFYMKLEFKLRSPQDLPYGPFQNFNLRARHYYMLLALGEDIRRLGPTGNIGAHFPENVHVNTEKVNLALRLSPYPYQVMLFRTHGILMTVAWLFCMPVGNFIARYFKDTLVHYRIYGMALWGFLHAGLMMISIVCILAATFFHVLGKEGWDGPRSSFHSFGGILNISLVIILLITGLWVKERKAGTRKLFNICHGVFGHAAYLIACGLFMDAPRVHHTQLSCRFRWNVILWLLSYLIMHVVMSYHYCWIDYIMGITARNNAVAPTTTISEERVSTSDVSVNRDLSLRRVTPIPDFGTDQLDNSGSDGSEFLDNNHIHLKTPGKKLRVAAVGIFTLVNLAFVIVFLHDISNSTSCYDTDDYVQIYNKNSK